ncbi:hypothetical protein Bca52824_008312 [Brassica carinata]|uniref:TLDc domain-containing protein n=1 Tax=Brassica carinata TaxID=52824 RepID=A0A8X8B620_BRACI|nr:hypothetical protein Bca52824_008312 [Brassica carinata]
MKLLSGDVTPLLDLLRRLPPRPLHRQSIMFGPDICGYSTKKSLLSKYKQHPKNFYQAVKFSKDQKGNAEVKTDDDEETDYDGGLEMKQMQNKEEAATIGQSIVVIPEISEPSLLLTDQSRRSLYTSLPALVQGRKWILLYSTWRHGISLSTLYRKSLLWPGLSLLGKGNVENQKEAAIKSVCGLRGPAFVDSAAEQITGQPSVLYYAPSILQTAGFSAAGDATRVSILLGLLKLIMTGVAVVVIDRLGRRPLLLGGVGGMVSPPFFPPLVCFHFELLVF